MFCNYKSRHQGISQVRKDKSTLLVREPSTPQYFPILRCFPTTPYDILLPHDIFLSYDIFIASLSAATLWLFVLDTQQDQYRWIL